MNTLACQASLSSRPDRIVLHARCTQLLLAALVMALVGSAPASAGQAGMLDPSFGEAGVVAGVSGDVVLQPDGRILVVGPVAGSDRNVLRRLTADGQVDRTFGDAGTVTEPGGITGAVPIGVLARSDGTLFVHVVVPGAAQDAVVALDARGALDPAWADGGILALSEAVLGDSVRSLWSIILDADGGLLVSMTSATNPLGVVARISRDGRRDDAFAAGIGIIEIPALDYPRSVDYVSPAPALSILQGGGFVAQTCGDYYGLICRFLAFTARGVIDPGIGNNGERWVGGGADHLAVSVVPNGLLLANTTEVDLRVYRVMPLSGAEELMWLWERRGDSAVSALAIDAALRPIVGGIVSGYAGGAFVARLNEAGGVDATFGKDGVVTFTPGGWPGVTAIRPTPKGDLLVLVVGVGLLRLVGDGQPTPATALARIDELGDEITRLVGDPNIAQALLRNVEVAREKLAADPTPQDLARAHQRLEKIVHRLQSHTGRRRVPADVVSRVVATAATALDEVDALRRHADALH